MLGSVLINVTLIAVPTKTFRIASYGTVQLPTNLLNILFMERRYPTGFDERLKISNVLKSKF